MIRKIVYCLILLLYFFIVAAQADADDIDTSLCKKDQDAVMGLKLGWKNCLHTYLSIMAVVGPLPSEEEARTIDVCSFIYKLRRCLKESLRTHCTTSFDNYAKHIMDIAFREPEEQRGCVVQARQIDVFHKRYPLYIKWNN